MLTIDKSKCKFSISFKYSAKANTKTENPHNKETRKKAAAAKVHNNVIEQIRFVN